MLIRRRDLVLAEAERWLSDLSTREHTMDERLLFDALGTVPVATSVTDSMLRRVGRPVPDLTCCECKIATRDGHEFAGAVVCLMCLTRAQRELSRL